MVRPVQCFPSADAERQLPSRDWSAHFGALSPLSMLIRCLPFTPFPNLQIICLPSRSNRIALTPHCTLFEPRPLSGWAGGVSGPYSRRPARADTQLEVLAGDKSAPNAAGSQDAWRDSCNGSTERGVEQKAKRPPERSRPILWLPIFAQRPFILSRTSTSITLFLIVHSDLESG
jgi:hypothetical protein